MSSNIQTIFNKAYRGAKERLFKKCGDYWNCRYRYRGNACIIGGMIKDEFYKRIFDRDCLPANNPKIIEALNKSGVKINSKKEIKLLLSLQRAHDLADSVEKYQENLKRLANRLKLKIPKR